MQIGEYLYLLQLAGVDLCLFRLFPMLFWFSLLYSKLLVFVFSCGPCMSPVLILGEIFGLHVLWSRAMKRIVYCWLPLVAFVLVDWTLLGGGIWWVRLSIRGSWWNSTRDWQNDRFLYSKNTALGMPDSRFKIIDEKPFFNLNLQIRVHPIHHFRRRWSFRAGSHAKRFEQTTHFPILGGLFEPISEWMGAAQVIAK